MSNPAIIVNQLSKSYRLGAINRHTLSEEIQHLWCRLLRINPQQKMGMVGAAPRHQDELFWALKDMSFSVNKGEVMGLIGGNGAGKSTLLKLLTRITEPTSGEAHIQGRIASLLEVGTGFHPELTGRENVFMNGSILGMKRPEIAAKFDEIVAFAEVDQFIDTPVKRYSSGMYVRLAFAVAAHLESEILLVDEVLAVGDAAFQKKCLDKMRDVTRDGRTVLFVSHNMGAVRSLCDSGLYLRAGKVQAIGPSTEVVDHYLHDNLMRAKKCSVENRTDRSGTGDVRITHLNASFDSQHHQWVFTLEYETQKTFPWHIPSARIVISQIEGMKILACDSGCMPDFPNDWPLKGRLEVRSTPDVALPRGEYFVQVSLLEKNTILDLVKEALVFTVGEETPFQWKQYPFHKSAVFHQQTWSITPAQ